MRRFQNLLLAFISGILLWAAWPVSPLGFLIFIAWIPLLWIELRVKSIRKFFVLTYVTMFTWNVATTWWIWNASEPGAVAAFLANSFLMCFPWMGFKIVRRKLGENSGYLSLVAFWICFEFIHLQDWGLSWPWLTLGNAFANHPHWVQWYEYTGTSGGTLWILAVNILLFIFIKYNFIWRTQKTLKHIFIVIPILLIPLLFSLLDGLHKTMPGNRDIVIVQPNIDPYEKISDEAGSLDSQLHKLISLSEQAIDSNTALVIWPETALYTAGGIVEQQMNEDRFLEPLWQFLRRHPHINLFTGIESIRLFSSPTRNTRQSGDQYYEAYNGSMLLDSSGIIGTYHKSMLVPGVETLPWFLKFIDSWFAKFGGTTAGYAKQDERTVLNATNGYKIAPAICYESIYGEFMSQYISNGANIICVITNDGWWGNTPGYKQHMNYARLRAIETRTWVARSANTGISCFIDPYGDVWHAQPWNTAAVTKMAISPGHEKTFFVKHDDIISRAMVVISIIMIGWNLVLWIMKKFYSKKLPAIKPSSDPAGKKSNG